MVGYELDPCRVHGDGGELIAAGHVRSHEDGRLLIEVPRYSGGSLWPGDPVVVVLANPLRGEVTLDAVVALSARGRIEVGSLAMRAVEQKRSAVRVPMSEEIRFVARLEGTEELPLDPALEGVVLDLSAHGIRFRTQDVIPLGTLLVGALPTPRRAVPLVVEVLRHDALRGATGHGGRFVGMAHHDTEELFRVVLDRQRRLIAERRDAG